MKNGEGLFLTALVGLRHSASAEISRIVFVSCSKRRTLTVRCTALILIDGAGGDNTERLRIEVRDYLREKGIGRRILILFYVCVRIEWRRGARGGMRGFDRMPMMGR